jgi:hypothetical protein
MRGSLLLLFALCFASPPGETSTATTTTPAESGVPVTCVKYWGEARYAPYGYDHVVHLVSSCDRSVRCDVSTDVDPTILSVTVSPKEHVEVVTRRRSPSQSFAPRATCHGD